MKPPAATLAIVVKGYPRLSETFIAQEIRGLEKAGLRLEIVSLRRPSDTKRHPVHDEIEANVRYLPEYLHEAPLRVLRAWRRARRLPGYRAARRLFLADLWRDFTRNRMRRFGQALVLAGELGARYGAFHAHFIHTPASVARYAAVMMAKPWTCSAHAKDIWTSADWDLADKLKAARWVVTCTRAGHDRLRALSPAPDRVHLSYHGLDLDRFDPFAGARSTRDGRDPAQPVDIVTVGRAVEKKGFDLLLAALARLPRDLHWRLTHVGTGELLAALKAQAEAAGMADRIVWLGAQPQTAVLDLYRRADLFVLPCRIARDGDRDGLPNVLVEAASQGLACIVSDLPSILELFAHEENALVVAREDSQGLAAALARAIADADLRARLGRAAAQRVRADFDHRSSIAGLMDLFAGNPVSGSR